MQRITLTRLIEEGLHMRLAAQSPKKLKKPFVLPVFNDKSGLVM